MARRSPLALALPLLASLLAACAEPEAPPPSTPAKVAATNAPMPPAMPLRSPPVAPGHLARADLERVLRQGPPWLLRRVVPEEVIRGGKFVGWRILSMPTDWGIDLKSGDVVTRVNGLQIERPDDLWAVWVQLQSAPELRISYERDGQVHDIALAIDGPSAAGSALKADEPPPAAPPTSRWKTTVIVGDDSAPPPEPEGE